MNNILLENYIKSFLKQNQINSLHIFDFDMTLYDHDKESWIEHVILDLKESLENPQTRVILCTARTNGVEYIEATEKLLKQNNMSLNNFDQCYFKSTYRKESVPIYKSHVVLDEVCANNDILTVKFWDDREDTLQKVGIDLKNHNQSIEYIPVKC